MREINLLPPEAFQRLSARRTRARLVLVGILYLVLLALLTLLWQGRVNSAEDLVTIQRAQNSTLEQRVLGLSDAQTLADEYDADVRLIQQALSIDMSWGRLLNDFARLIPDRIWLESFAGSISDGPDTALGTITVTGVGFSYPDVSAWIRSLNADRFPGVDGTWVDTVSEALIGEADVVNFSSTTALTPSALSDRIGSRVPVIVP